MDTQDVVVFEEPDDKFYVGVHKSRSEAVIYVSCGSAVTSEIRYILADKPESEFQVVLPRVQVGTWAHRYVPTRIWGK